jgi:hypothetical protein
MEDTHLENLSPLVKEIQRKLQEQVDFVEDKKRELVKERAEADAKWKQLEEETKKITFTLELKKVKLNVGGKPFTTSLSTLTSTPSMLATMFSGKFELKPDEDGEFFIDRDGTYFR